MKHYFKVIQVIVIIVFMVFFGSCEENKIVARAGNHVIYLQDLNSRLESHRLAEQARQSYSDMVDFLNDLVEEKLIVIDAYRKGLDNDSSVVAGMKDFEQRQIYSHVIQHQVIEQVIPETMLREQYEQNAREWKVRHIFLPAGENRQHQKRQLAELRSRILRGADFGSLAREFSQDSLSAGKGGDLGFLKWGDKNWGEAFYQQISKLQPGVLSNIIESEKGLHLALVEQVRAVDQPPFKELYDQLQRDLFREYVDPLDSTYSSFIDDLEKRYDAQVIDANVDSLASMIQQNTSQDMNMRRMPTEFFQNLPQSQQTLPLATYKGGVYTVKDLFQTYSNISSMRRPALADSAIIQEFLRRNIPRVLAVQLGYDRRVDKRREIRQAVKEEKEKLMRNLNRQQSVVEKINPTEEDVRRYFEEHRHLYELDAKVKIQEITVYSLEKAQELYERIQNGHSFEALLQEYEPQSPSVDELPFISGRDYGPVGRRAVKLKTGEISEPINNNNRYSIVKVVDRLAGEVPPYDEIKNRVRRELRVNIRRELEEEWLNRLRETIPVVVYEHEIRKEFGFTDEE